MPTLRVKSLASGSSGNAYLIWSGDEALLVDAGIPLRAVQAELARIPGRPRLVGVCLTHEHADHASAVGAVCRRYDVPLIASPGTLDGLYRLGLRVDGVSQPVGTTLAMGSFFVTSFGLPHDALQPVGYLVGLGPWRVVLAVDLGQSCEDLVYALRQADLIILDSNHDLRRLLAGPYSSRLKARIAAPNGHLSNEQAAQILLRVADGRPRTVWLAHLSAVNNSPRLARRTVRQVFEQAGANPVRVEVALRDRPSAVWSPFDAAVQGRFDFGPGLA
ncbi:MAG: MBL fold metallo-hydrolase [Chloroflexota bacterium]